MDADDALREVLCDGKDRSLGELWQSASSKAWQYQALDRLQAAGMVPRVARNCYRLGHSRARGGSVSADTSHLTHTTTQHCMPLLLAARAAPASNGDT